MKRVGYLYNDVFSIENIYQAMIEYNRNREARNKIEPCYLYAAKLADRMKEDFAAVIGTPRRKVINECGKKRELEIPSYDSCIAQIAIWNIAGKYIEKRIHMQSFSSRKGMGGHLAAQKCSRFVAQHIEDDARYHLYFDIRKYYQHIRKDLVMESLRRIFKDEQLLELFRIVVYSTPVGLPIGYPFSHALANLYLTPLYYLIYEQGKKQYRATKIYVYMDNWTIFARYKKPLHQIRDVINKWLAEHGCEMKDDWQIAPTKKRGVKICGFIIGYKTTRLYRGIWHRLMRNVDRFRKNYWEKDYLSLMSRLGWLKAIHRENSPVFGPERKHKWQLKTLRESMEKCSLLRSLMSTNTRSSNSSSN